MKHLLLDLGINLIGYFNLNFTLKTNIDIFKIFESEEKLSEQLISDLLNIIINFKFSGINLKYLENTLNEVFKELDNKETKKIIDQMMRLLKFVCICIGANLEYEYAYKAIKINEQFKKDLISYNQLFISLSNNMIRPFIENGGFSVILKGLNLNYISIALGIPKFLNGLSIVIKNSGLNKYFEKILK